MSSDHNLTPEQAHTVTRLYEVGDTVEEILHIAQSQKADLRWLAIAKTHLQLGFMAAKRSITNPPSFTS